MECAKKSLVLIAEHLKSKNAVLAVEDLPRTCLGRNSSDILELCSAHPDLRACFDTNHLLGEDITEFIRKTGHLYVTTHVSDYDFINERHWLCGEGKIDWLSLKKELENVGYDGPWLYEISLNGSEPTIDRDRRLTYSDFAENYRQIMSNSVPEDVGRGKENLPMFV
jgi:sugar phosphate isomerase/epimerase